MNFRVFTLGLSLVAAGWACLLAQGSTDSSSVEARLRGQLGPGSHVRSAEGFVCGSNGSARELDVVVDGTVVPCARALWKQYFRKRPPAPLKVYLFKDEASYRAGAKRLFGDTGVSLYGYCRYSDRALVMNIGTGTGTLVHEMVHALMEPDFPKAPTWFSEGLASLYEQCEVNEAGLTGLVNWRLPILQVALKDRTALPLAKLLATSEAEFRNGDESIHYAQARYFCMYMQEKGVLGSFYEAFRDAYAKDPTGALFAAEALKEPLPKAEKDWLKWVASLKITG